MSLFFKLEKLLSPHFSCRRTHFPGLLLHPLSALCTSQFILPTRLLLTPSFLTLSSPVPELYWGTKRTCRARKLCLAVLFHSEPRVSCARSCFEWIISVFICIVSPVLKITSVVPVETLLCNVQNPNSSGLVSPAGHSGGRHPAAPRQSTGHKGTGWGGGHLGSPTAQPVGGSMQTQPWMHCHPGFEETFQQGTGQRAS